MKNQALTSSLSILFLYFFVRILDARQIYYDSVVTKHMNSVFTVESKWLASFVISFDPYENYFNTLEHDIYSASRVIQRYNSMFNTATFDSETKLMVSSFKLYEQRFESLKSTVKQLRNRVTGIQSIVPKSSRPKRALFSFIGDLLSGLTGVATKSDIDTLNERLKHVYQHNLDLAHLVEDSVSIMNVTKAKVSEIVDSVNNLNNMSMEVQLKLRNITRHFRDELSNVRMVDFYYQHTSFHITVLQDHLETVKTQIVHLESMLAHVFMHKVTPDIISVPHLRSLLSDIASSLSNDLKLPFDYNDDTMSYYQYLTCSPYLSPYGIGVVMSIPLLSTDSQYNVFQIINLPVPIRSGQAHVQYALNHTYIAISADRANFVHLTGSEYLQCTQLFTKFCHFTSPIRSTAKHLND